MKEKKLGDVLLVGGGIIPQKDVEELNSFGVGKLFGPGTDIAETIQYIETWCKENRHGA